VGTYLRLKFSDRLLLMTDSVVEAEALFRRRQQLLQAAKVRHLECWLCSRDHDILTPAFTADLDANGRLCHGDPLTEAERSWNEGWEEEA
jgi:hypothetical protein